MILFHFLLLCFLSAFVVAVLYFIDWHPGCNPSTGNIGESGGGDGDDGNTTPFFPHFSICFPIISRRARNTSVNSQFFQETYFSPRAHFGHNFLRAESRFFFSNFPAPSSYPIRFPPLNFVVNVFSFYQNIMPAPSATILARMPLHLFYP